MRKLNLQEFSMHEPRTGQFRLVVFNKFREIFTTVDKAEDASCIPWGRIYSELSQYAAFTVKSKEQWDEIRKNTTVKKLKEGGGAGKRHFMSLWYWLYMDHENQIENRRLNKAATDLIELILATNLNSFETLEQYHSQTYPSILDAGNPTLKYGADETPNTLGTKTNSSKMSAGKSLRKPKPKMGRVRRRKRGREFLSRGIMESYEKGSKYQHPFVLILDVDDLTIINKVHGWEVGSEILDIFEEEIRNACDRFLFKDEYECGICGDDTFFIVIYSEDLHDLSVIYNDFVKALEEYEWGEVSDGLRVSFSAGWSNRVDLESSLSCAQRAESGMNDAKNEKGMNTVVEGPAFTNFALQGKGFKFS